MAETTTRYDYLAEQLHRLLSGGDVPMDSPWDRRELLLAVQQAHARVVQASYWENLKSTGEHTVDGQLYVTFTGLPLTRNTDRGEWTAALPSAYMALPGGRGVQEVRWSGRPQDAALKPLPGNGTLYRQLPEYKALGWGYYIDGLTVAIPPAASATQPKAASVNVRLLVPGASGALPLEQEMLTLAEALKLLQVRQKPDTANDHNPTV